MTCTVAWRPGLAALGVALALRRVGVLCCNGLVCGDLFGKNGDGHCSWSCDILAIELT